MGNRVEEVLIFVVGVTLISCDSFFEVSGKIEKVPVESKEPCTLKLMTRTGPIWNPEKEITVRRSTQVDGEFSAGLVVSGPMNKDHWFEIECPGYERYKSKIYPFPNKEGILELGNIQVRKIGSEQPHASDAPKRRR